MKRKFYTLVLTFLCLFFGQLSFGQSIGEGGVQSDWVDAMEKAGVPVTRFDDLESFKNAHPEMDTNGDGVCSLSEVASLMFGFSIASVTTFAGEPAFILTDGSFFMITKGQLDEVVIINPTRSQHNVDPLAPFPGGPSGTTLPPCEDWCECFQIGCNDIIIIPIEDTYNPPACTKTCDSGYELDDATCDCILLPPCWGTVKDYETSNGFDTISILNSLNSLLGNLGITKDVMDFIKQSDMLSPQAIDAATDFRKYIGNLAIVGNVTQLGIDYSVYMNEPSTQNLLKMVFDSVVMAAGPAVSLAVTTFDYWKDSAGKSKLDYLLEAAANAIDREIDCNFGLGVRNAVF